MPAEPPEQTNRDSKEEIRTRRSFLGSTLSALTAVGLAEKSAAAAPPREHPYLFFAARDVPLLRRRLEQGGGRRPERWKQLLRNADALLNTPLTKGAVDISRTRAALGIIGITAFAYALTRDRRYADRSRREADALLASELWIKPGPGSRGANLGTGEASMACALCYDWCGDILTRDERAAFARTLFERGISPYLASIETHNDWWIKNDISNWAGVVNGGCGLAALAVYDEIPEARRAADYARARVASFLKTANRVDGGGDEGVMYYTYGMLFGTYFAAAAERFFGTDDGINADADAKLSGYWLVYMQGPDGRYANFNNMGEETFAGLPPKNPEGGPNATLCARWEATASGGGDRLLAWAADNGGDNYYWRGVSPFYLLFRSDRPAPATRPPLDAAALFRESGQTLWTTPALWFAFNGGWTSDRSHFNLDLGSFILVAGGERLLHDPGYGKTATGDHSTVLVNGLGQRKGAQGVYRRWGSGQGFRYLACDFSEAYEAAAGLTRFVRHAVLVGDSCLILVDDLAGKEDSRFEARFQASGTVQIGAEGDRATVVGKNQRLQMAFAASGTTPVRAAEGRGASAFVSAQPAEAGNTATLITVLLPTAAAQSDGTQLSVRFDSASGLLRVEGGVRADLKFEETPSGWALQSVNGESAAGIGTGKDRTLTSFRVKAS